MVNATTKWHVGIDIGTTNSSVCITSFNSGRQQFDDPEPVKIDGDKTLRSVLLFDESAEMTVEIGKAVYDHPEAAEFPDRVRSEFKLEFGREYYAAQCTKLLVARLIKEVLRILPDSLTTENCLTNVGAPAEWINKHPERIALLKQIVTDVGFPNVEVFAEPVAAMLYHAYLGQLPFENLPQNWLVVDIGGGTTDLAFVRVQPGGKQPQVISTHGYNLGGKDFDQAILERVLLKHYWIGGQPTASQKLDLLKASQQLKEGLSVALRRKESEYVAAFRNMRNLKELQSPVALSWEEFNSSEVAGLLVERFGQIVEMGMEAFVYGAGSIEKIILTGGSARWPFVRDQLEFLRSEENVLESLDPDLTIAKGLALARTEFKPPQPILAKLRKSWVDEVAVSPSEIVTMAKNSISTQGAENLLDKITLNELDSGFNKNMEICHKQAREKTLWFAGGGALGSAAVAQVPGLASAGLPVLETKLIIDIAQVYGYSIDTKQALTIGSGMIVSGMVVKMGVLELVGMIPGLGNLIKGGVAAGFVVGLGEAASKFFAKRRFG